MALTTDDTIQVSFFATLGNQTGINVLHYRVVAVSGTPVTEANAAAYFSALAAPLYLPLISSLGKYYGCGLQHIDPLPLGTAFYSGTGQASGTGGATPLPTQVAGLVSTQSRFAGKQYRGRFYPPFPGSDASDTAGNPKTGYLVNLAALAGGLMVSQTITSGINATQLIPVIWHRRTRTHDDIIGAVVRNKFATQRRRGGFGRPNPPPF